MFSQLMIRSALAAGIALAAMGALAPLGPSSGIGSQEPVQGALNSHSSLASADAGAHLSIRFLVSDEMSASDRILAANVESTIREDAAQLGYDLSRGNWSYQEIVCPVFPAHLFLQYRQDAGRGDVTEFSASIPRGPEGRVRIIPILKHSYSLFAPAPVNALSVAVFNHIREEESDNSATGWLGNALCYAALAGAHPQVPAIDANENAGERMPSMTAQLLVSVGGQETIQFDDVASVPHPMEWTLLFNRKGQLVKVIRRPAYMFKTRPAGSKSPNDKPWALPSETGR
jgi:hypothetical protein